MRAPRGGSPAVGAEAAIGEESAQRGAQRLSPDDAAFTIRASDSCSRRPRATESLTPPVGQTTTSRVSFGGQACARAGQPRGVRHREPIGMPHPRDSHDGASDLR